MTYATDTFAGDGSTVEFTITFDYIQRDHVTVSRVVKATQKATKLTVIKTGTPTGDQYVWETDKKIKVGTAPATTDELKIERDTPEDQQLVQWKDGSYVVATDLNTSDLQWLYGLQELEDKFSKLSISAIKYFGAIDLTVDKPPASPVGGTFYINTGAGLVLADWTGIAGDSVVGSEQVIYNDNTDEWEIFKVPSSQAGVLQVNATAPITVDNSDPQRPDIGFTDAPSDAEQYVRQSAKAGDPLAWKKVAIPPGTLIANPLPTSPEPEAGQLGYNTGDNRLYIWVYNTASPPVGSWVDASPAANPGVTQITAGDNITISPVGGTGNVTVNAADSMPTGGGSPKEDVFYENAQVIDENYSITAGKNALTAGPVTVNSTVTVPTGQTWTVVGNGGALWKRDGTTLKPATSNDNLDDIGSITATGNISTAGGIYTPKASIEASDGSASFSAGAVLIKGNGSLTTSGSCDFAGGNGYSTNATAGISSTGCYRSRNDSGTVANCFEIYKGGGGGSNVTLTLANDGMISSKGIIYSNRPANTDFSFVAQNAGTNNAVIRCDGTYFGQNTDIQPISSERRLKENIAAIDSETAWETIKNTPYYSYNFIGSESTVYGPMADEVPAEMVVQPMEENEEGVMVARSDDQGPIRSYDNGMLQARLYTALQLALTRIEALEAQLTALQEAN